MEGVKLYGGSSIKVLLQNERLHCPSEPFEPLWLQTSEPSFQDSRSMVNFENVGGSMIMDRPFFQPVVEKEEKVDDDDYEGCFHQGKKRRLTTEQVQFLERNFEVENKLDPERKVQLAKDLGLHPRQVAIWFQNRRARFKTKQIEKDYGALKASFDRLKSEHDNLVQENQKLKEEANSLKKRLVPREKEEENFGEKFFDSVNSGQIGHTDLVSNACSKIESTVPLPVMVMCKQEDANSAKSDVVDSDSPNYSDFSQDEEENMNQELLTTLPFLPKVEDDDCYRAPHENSCNFGFPIEDPVFALTESYYY